MAGLTLGRVLLAVAGALVLAGTASSAEPDRPAPLKSGLEFAGEDVRALQADNFANPGMLWAARGAKLWDESAGTSGKSCAGCHGAAEETMKGVAARYPRFDPGAGRLLNLEGRINACRSRNQGAAPLAYESEDLLSLTTHVAHQSRGLPMSVSIDDENRRHFERGRALYFRRIGQMNLSCAQCHDRNWGKRLLGETISQGHGNAYPIYRLEWQGAGSLHRRFRSCYYGVRAEMLPGGSDDYLDLELYLAWRANGLPMETPGVRR